MIEEVAFQRIDVRLAERILQLAQGEVVVRLTHQQLAAELGTVREVISRQLSEFQRRDWIKQSCGVIQILDVAVLEQLALV